MSVTHFLVVPSVSIVLCYLEQIKKSVKLFENSIGFTLFFNYIIISLLCFYPVKFCYINTGCSKYCL